MAANKPRSPLAGGAFALRLSQNRNPIVSQTSSRRPTMPVPSPTRMAMMSFPFRKTVLALALSSASLTAFAQVSINDGLDGQWYDASAGGRGVSVDVMPRADGGALQYGVVFAYDAAGKPHDCGARHGMWRPLAGSQGRRQYAHKTDRSFSLPEEPASAGRTTAMAATGSPARSAMVCAMRRCSGCSRCSC